MPNSDSFLRNTNPEMIQPLRASLTSPGLWREQKTFDTGSERVSMLGKKVSLKGEKAILYNWPLGTQYSLAHDLHTTPHSHTCSPTITTLPGSPNLPGSGLAFFGLQFSPD